MKEKIYATCPYCQINYLVIIPKGGDGSALFFRRHHRTIGVYPYRKRELCPGSYQEVDIQDEAKVDKL